MVDIIGRAKVIVESSIDKSSLDTTGSKIGAGIKTGAVVGVAALGTLAVAGVKAFQAFEEAEAQSRKLNQVLDNMGESAAAPAVEELAEKLRKLTGVDDEVIKQGQTLLATFSNVAQSAGDVGGVFERATIAAVDLSATGFGSVESASVMLGKALQDPEKGITALGRAGVTFTEEQKALIAGFVEANDVASAQAIILGEVEKQVGGTAEATVTESAKISSAMGELKETFGLFVDDLISGSGETKTFSEQLEALNEQLIELQETDAWKAISGAIRGIGHAIEFVGDALGAWADFWYDAGKAFGDFTDSVGADVDFLIEKLRDIPYIGRFVPDADDPITDYDRTLGADDLERLLLNGRASGGPASGWTLVGERGPEIVKLPNGSYVNSSANSQLMLDGAGGESIIINYNNFGPVTGNEQKRETQWALTYGLRFGAITGASPSVVNS
jgi:hypothetical protein